MRIQLVNHASVRITAGDCVVLTDPWYEGSVFNDGWDLLAPTPPEAASLADVDFIWISHEHPDHFSPRFFATIDPATKERVEILFQETRDRRVAGFLRGEGFRVREVPDRKAVQLTQRVSIVVGKVDFYDSWLSLRDGDASLLDLNDCPLLGLRELTAIRRLVGEPDVLLTQFSYAAWKGGRENREYRVRSAQQKLESLRLQCEQLAARAVIPFASFIYFSNEENRYLNDSINTAGDVCRALEGVKTKVVALLPGQAYDVGAEHDNAPAVAFWRDRVENIARLPSRAAGPSVPVEELRSAFSLYRARLKKSNNRLFLLAARFNPFVRGLQPVRVFLTDLGRTVRVSIIDGFSVAGGGAVDVKMHSTSLKFVFDHDFGFDTLTVNGRFEATRSGFRRMAKSFALGSLNALGFRLGFALLAKPQLVLWLLRRVARVSARLSDGRVTRPTAAAPSPSGPAPTRPRRP